MRYKAVLFDMDGTVLNTVGDLTAAVNHTLGVFGMPERSEDEIKSFLGNGAKRLLTLSAPEGTSETQIDTMLLDYMPYYNAHCKELTAPYDGIIPLIEALKEAGARIAVISNKQDEAVKPLAEEFFPGLLEFAIGESASVRRKPNPDSVLAAAEFFGTELSQTIYIGDTEVDIQTAKNAGMDCAAVCWGFRSEQELIEAGAQMLFKTPAELKDFLLG